ncbi:phosphate acetyltransferase [Aliiroseovarius halocynthiae]|uniref:Phosphate acetyltransferase n=1 Tax=Aliiroseovarius halocynthiae TaxID=985055 RepID=A0A545SSK0_9RHOB|nr:phosphate acyltransferase [Aliiroseovarius halocynthiae]TQV67943.1 phosphate acetyltransferase [Aliiroseovarius halocynthiae]SMR73045.1 phosphate acetyltransferase [Aliiroseovarius halocynthiae]
MTATLDRAFEIAAKRKPRVVLPEMEDPRIAEAAARLHAEGLASPVPLADCAAHHVDALISTRAMRPAIATRLLQRPLMRAAAMVATGEADLMVAGAIAPTRRVIEAASMVIGLKKGIATPSSYFLMVLSDGQEFIFSDCAVNVDPDAQELADIATASAGTARAFWGRAEVALLSFSTGHSGAGASVEKVREAANLTGFAGPVQADAALDLLTAQKKQAGLTEKANVLIFPNLDAGNIAYKLLVHLAGAKAYGPILQGFKRPICDLSRGATVDEIVAATVLSIAGSDGL